MSEELDLLGDQEFVLRRIHISFYRAGLPTPIQRAAFRPNHQDTTGLSVYRARFVVTYADLLRNVKEEKRKEYYICRLSVSELIRMGLTVVPDPDPQDIPGHCLVPELSWSNYQADHDRLANIQEELAILASQDIVRKPAG